MGSNITLGLVYDNKKNIALYLESIVKLIQSGDGEIRNFKFSLDEDGKEWISKNGEDGLDKSDYKSLTRCYYGEINMKSKVFDVDQQKINISIEITNDFIGFLIDFNEEELIQVLNLDDIENKIIDFITENYNMLKFKYAFCDHEAELEFSPSEIAAHKEELYSLLFIPYNKNSVEIEIKKGSWKLDGLTGRS